MKLVLIDQKTQVGSSTLVNTYMNGLHKCFDRKYQIFSLFHEIYNSLEIWDQYWWLAIPISLNSKVNALPIWSEKMDISVFHLWELANIFFYPGPPILCMSNTLRAKPLCNRIWILCSGFQQISLISKISFFFLNEIIKRWL